ELEEQEVLIQEAKKGLKEKVSAEPEALTKPEKPEETKEITGNQIKATSPNCTPLQLSFRDAEELLEPTSPSLDDQPTLSISQENGLKLQLPESQDEAAVEPNFFPNLSCSTGDKNSKEQENKQKLSVPKEVENTLEIK